MQKQFNTAKHVAASLVVLGSGLFGVAQAHAASWLWPTTSHTISYAFVEDSHLGVDIDGETGDPVYAAHKGIVMAVSQDDSRGMYIKIRQGKKNSYALRAPR